MKRLYIYVTLLTLILGLTFTDRIQAQNYVDTNENEIPDTYDAMNGYIPTPCMSAYDSLDSSDGDDGLGDECEAALAWKFAPVLHKQKDERQEALARPEDLINRADLRFPNENNDVPLTDPDQYFNQFILYPAADGELYHAWSVAYDGPMVWVFPTDFESPRFDVNIHNEWRDVNFGSPDYLTTVYYHAFQPENSNKYILQYWFFYSVNDLRQYDPPLDIDGHEGDWEKVTIQLDSDFQPELIHFNAHHGGRSYLPSECWWGKNRGILYADVVEGYDDDHTHLHIWPASGSHASYNRGQEVFVMTIETIFGTYDYRDHIDYDWGYQFKYKNLVNMGEVEIVSIDEMDTYYQDITLPENFNPGWTEFSVVHGDGAPAWMAFQGRWGFGINSGVKGPRTPALQSSWTEFNECYEEMCVCEGGEIDLFWGIGMPGRDCEIAPRPYPSGNEYPEHAEIHEEKWTGDVEIVNDYIIPSHHVTTLRASANVSLNPHVDLVLDDGSNMEIESDSQLSLSENSSFIVKNASLQIDGQISLNENNSSISLKPSNFVMNSGSEINLNEGSSLKIYESGFYHSENSPELYNSLSTNKLKNLRI